MIRTAPAAIPKESATSPRESANGDGDIRPLPPAVAAQIAAGEVIERPASVVKELIENALDAGATRIAVTAQEAGLRLISLSDDGGGIPADQLALAFERHATSKLREADDLFRLRGFGFRGEALPSIAAAAEVDCLSRVAGTDLGARLALRGGFAGPVEAAGAPLGTTIEVRDLFGRQPARRKFLGGPRGERAAIARVCAEAALSRPAVSITLTLDGRTLFSSGGEGDRRGVLHKLWGGEAASAALSFAGEAIEAGLRVEGLAAPPPHHRARRDGILLFVNHRPVQSRRLAYAIEEAYRELRPSGRYPLAACFLSVDPARVDVNVHPTKAQVKLADESAAFSLIQRSLRDTLLAALRPRPLDAPAPAIDLPPPAPVPARLWSDRPALAARPALASAIIAPPSAPPSASQASSPSSSLQPSLPLLRVVGQLSALFIVAEGPQGMYLIDQHAAHERVLYERLLAMAGSGAPARQPLLDPPLLELSPTQAAALIGFERSLAAVGFDLEPFGDAAVRLRALPALLSPRDARSSLLALLDDLAGADRVPARYDPVAAATACHAAVRAGQTLSPEEMRALLRDLEQADNPHTCPHGRPTLLHLPTEDLERRFGRR